MQTNENTFKQIKQEIEENEKKINNNYEIKSSMGQGAFGIVLHCIDKISQESCAIKVINKNNNNSNHINRLRYEAESLALLSHPNIVKFQKIIETENRLFMVMDLVKGGTLHSIMVEKAKKKERFTDLEASIIMKHLFLAVKYLHENDFVHRDLKPENILLDDINELSTIKVADFGLSVQFGREFITKQLTQTCGTLVYMSPEMINHKPYGKPIDIWSCGIIMYLLLSNYEHPLFTNQDNENSYIEKLINPIFKFPSHFSKYSIDLFLRLMKIDPSERYRPDDALNHPWITRHKNPVPQSICEQKKTYQNQINFFNLEKIEFIIAKDRNQTLPISPLSVSSSNSKKPENNESKTKFSDNSNENIINFSFNLIQVQKNNNILKKEGEININVQPKNLHRKNDSFDLGKKKDSQKNLKTQNGFLSPQKKLINGKKDSLFSKNDSNSPKKPIFK